MSQDATIVGIDRCRGQWIAAHLTTPGNDAGWRLRWLLAERFLDVVDPAAAVIGIDIPIGLVDAGTRAADVEARQSLPGWARSRVFLTPPRAVITRCGHLDNAAIQALSRSLTGSGVSKQSLGLAPAILDVDGVLATHSRLREITVEVHPELSFAHLCAVPALPAKKSAAGVGLRIAALTRAWGSNVSTMLAAAPSGVGVDDCLDALAAAWSANRYRLGQAFSWPHSAANQQNGLGRMAIVV